MNEILENLTEYNINELENMINIYYQKYIETRNDDYLMVINQINEIILQKSNNFSNDTQAYEYEQDIASASMPPTPPNDLPMASASMPPTPPNDLPMASASMPPTPPDNQNFMCELQCALKNYQNSSFSSSLNHMLSEEEKYYHNSFSSELRNLLWNNENEIIIIKGLTDNKKYLLRYSRPKNFRDSCGRSYDYTEFIKVNDGYLATAYNFMKSGTIEDIWNLENINYSMNLVRKREYEQNFIDNDYFVVDFSNENIYYNGNDEKRLKGFESNYISTIKHINEIKKNQSKAK